jgi:hypothetical protein
MLLKFKFHENKLVGYFNQLFVLESQNLKKWNRKLFVGTITRGLRGTNKFQD